MLGFTRLNKKDNVQLNDNKNEDNFWSEKGDKKSHQSSSMKAILVKVTIEQIA